jgi:hypothetical protein
MSIKNSLSRTRQMWPLGEGLGDNVLEGEIAIDMSDLSQQYSISWQVSDPRLSGHKGAWVVDTEEGSKAGTYNEQNTNEPDEGSD